MSQLHRLWRVAPLLLLPILSACDRELTDPVRARADMNVAAGIAPLHETAERIPDRYIVVLHAGAGPASAMASDVAATLGGRIHHTYSAALNGFAATLSAEAVEALRRNPSVSYIVQDGRVSKTETVQENATWGLDRSDQRDLPLSTTYSYTADGSGVTVYVLDTGIRPTHDEFGSRASVGADFIGDGQNGIDCDGHGTHVAGTAVGTTYGIAKNADVVAVRVLDCFGNGTFAGVTAGVDWVTANHQKPAVANMSLGGGVNAALNQAVQNSIAAGVTYAVAAGNSNANACNFSPASTPEAITVAGTTAADERISPSNAWFGSNFGSCVDVFAPGLFIESAWHTADNATETISGTSMSSPHVAGVAALYLQDNPDATPEQVANAINATATRGRIADVGAGSPNLLLFSLLTEEPPAAIIALNPSSLSFTFVVDEQGAQMSGGVPSDSADIPAFRAGGLGSFKLGAASNPDEIRLATAVSASASAVVRLTNVGTAPLEWTATTNRPWIGVSPNEGQVAPNGMTPLTATVTATNLDQGSHTGAIAITDPDAANSPGTLPVTANVLTGTRLHLGTPLPGLAAPLNNERYFMIDVPAGHFDLTFRISGGTGDADMYVRFGDVPTRTPAAWDCRPFLTGNNEVCTVAQPRAGTYYVMLHAWSAYSGVTLEVTVAPTTPAAPSNLAGTATSAPQVNLTWSDNSVNETGFSIQRSSKLQGNTWSAFEDVGTAAADATSFADTSVERDRSYIYRIRACNAQGCSAWANSGQIDTPKGGPRNK